jgi:hypothetical protein
VSGEQPARAAEAQKSYEELADRAKKKQKREQAHAH